MSGASTFAIVGGGTLNGGAFGAPNAVPPYAADAEAPSLRARTRTCLALSLGLHALLLAWLILAPQPVPDRPPLTEITMIDPGDLDATPAPAAPAATAARTSGVVTSSSADEHFRRQASRADLAPTPQDVGSIDDRLNARLAAMQRDVVAPSAGIVPAAPSSMWPSAPATVMGRGTSGHAAVALTRGGSGGAAPLALARGLGTGTAPAPALVTAAATPGASQAPAHGGDAGARRSLAGATLMGPIADRTILSRTTPAYPDWARRDAVEGSVTLYFVVRPDGTVKENVLVQKTAGFEEFDDNARTAIRAWRFEALSGGRTGEQWGTITFHFRLRDGG